MENYKNIETFSNSYNINKNIPKNLFKLLVFTSTSKINRKLIINYPLYRNIKKDNNSYILKHNKKEYPFSILSDYEIQEFDKKILKTEKRYKQRLSRTLKLACSMDLVNPRVAIGHSSFNRLHTIIIFQDNGTDKIIDYDKNLIMKKDDYYELFDYKEINIIDKADLYNIYYITDTLADYSHIYEYLIFTKELFKELSKTDKFSFLAEKYDRNGINNNNYILFGNNSDSLFFQEKDVTTKYNKIIDELDEFTKNPEIKTKHISHDKQKEKYELKERNFGFFEFNLLSDMIYDTETKEQLLSKNRYHKCHRNSIIIARSLEEKTTYIVGGKIKINENDYFNHSWVEIDENNVVIDFNHNVIMNRDKYYKLFEAKPISKTLSTEMEDIIQTIYYDAELDLHPLYLNYFGKEIMNDLKKNEKILQKKP